MHTLIKLLVGATLGAATLAISPALAQTYPVKPVKIMVGASAGGGTDIIARVLAEKFAEGLKQPFVVENRPGASNEICSNLSMRSFMVAGLRISLGMQYVALLCR